MNAACEQYGHGCGALPYTGFDLIVLAVVGLAILACGVYLFFKGR